MPFRFKALKPDEDFGDRKSGRLPFKRWLNLPDTKAASLFYSTGKRARGILLSVMSDKDSPVRHKVAPDDDACAKRVGQILDATEPLLLEAIADGGNNYLVAMDSLFCPDAPISEHIDSLFPPSIYYATFTLYWLDLALTSFNEKANDEAAYSVSVATQFIARAEAHTSSKNAIGLTNRDLMRLESSAVAARKREVATSGATATAKLSERRRQITAQIYRVSKKYHHLSAPNAAVRILPEVQKTCRQLMPGTNSIKPKPGVGVVVEVIRKIKKEAPQ